MKKRFIVLFALLFALIVLPLSLHAADADSKSGTCGDALYWSFDEPSKTLFITGSGEMTSSPWSSSWNIEKVSIGTGATNIVEGAFWNCSTITSVTIPETVTRIDDLAFFNCSALTSITLPGSLTYIGEDAFNGAGLATVTLPNGIKTIGNEAFANCTSLTTITIPSSVTSLGEGVFSGCTSLTTINVQSGNTKYKSSNGILLSSDGRTLLIWPSGKTSGSIPSSVTTIGESSFDSSKITSITIPDTVTTIGRAAFFYCKSLTSVDLGSGVKSIGENAFCGCTALTSITIPSSVTEMGETVFWSCEGLKTAKVQCSVLPKMTFDSCYALTTVELKEGLKEIGDQAFHYCESLKSITIPNSVQTIGDYAFAYCTSLTKVTIPDSVTSLGYYAFAYCRGITSVTFGNGLTAISNGAFSECTSLASLAIPNSVTSIDKYAFKYCESLKTITIPASVTNIADYAFNGIYNTETITYYGTEEQKAAITIGTGNYILEKLEWHCITKPEIVDQSTSQTVASGKSAKFYVIANGATSYQWQYSKDNGATWTNWSGKTSPSITVTGSATNNGCLYRCVVKNGQGSITSNAARLTVSNVKPMILTQPKAVTVASGKNTTFKVVAGGTGKTYQWQYSKNNGTSWTNWSGKTANTLTVTGSATNNGCLYRCIVKNNYGSVTSASARLTVSGVKPNIVYQTSDVTYPVGHTVTLKVVAAGTSLSYQWYYSKNNGTSWTKWSGKTSADVTFSASATNNGCMYRCVVKNNKGSVTSSQMRLTVSGAKPNILVQPTNQTIPSGQIVTFTVSAWGENLTYQWQWSKDGKTWKNCTSTGYNQATFKFKSASSLSGRQYRCMIKNSNGTVYTNAVLFKVK